jgi:hypothetical protein
VLMMIYYLDGAASQGVYMIERNWKAIYMLLIRATFVNSLVSSIMNACRIAQSSASSLHTPLRYSPNWCLVYVGLRSTFAQNG